MLNTYEKGDYTEIEFLWSYASQKLTISNRKGSYRGMLLNRKFTIILSSGQKKVIKYEGKKTAVKF